MSELVINAATRDEFWRLGDEDETRIRQALPAGWSVRRCDAAPRLPKMLRGDEAHPGARAVIGWPFPAAMARRAPSLRRVHFWTAGVPAGWDALVRQRPELTLTTSPGINRDSVAEHALMLALAALRGVTPRTFSEWRPGDVPVARSPSVLDATIVGAGHVGSRLAELVVPLFRSVRLLARTARPAAVPPVRCADDTAVGSSDVIFLCLPSTPDARALFGSRFFAELRPDVLIVNVGRGDLLAEAALLGFLSQNQAARYAADVAAPEPYPADGALYTSPQVLLTPHLGGRRNDLWPALIDRTLITMQTDWAE